MLLLFSESQALWLESIPCQSPPATWHSLFVKQRRYCILRHVGFLSSTTHWRAWWHWHSDFKSSEMLCLLFGFPNRKCKCYRNFIFNEESWASCKSLVACYTQDMFCLECSQHDKVTEFSEGSHSNSGQCWSWMCSQQQLVISSSTGIHQSWWRLLVSLWSSPTIA